MRIHLVPCVVSLLCATLALPAATQGPGLGNLTYAPGEVFTPISTLRSPHGHGNCAMVKGYLMLIYSSDGGGTSGDGGIEFWDASNPRSPSRVVRYDDARTNGLREAHGYAFSYSYPRSYLCAQGVTGIQFWDVTDPLNLQFTSGLDLPGISAGDYEGAWWLFWQAPWVYVAGVSQGLFIVDASDPTHPVLTRRLTTGELGGLSPSQVFAVGNLMVLTKSRDNTYVTLDISDPQDPRVLQVYRGAIGYSHVFAGGQILTSGGDGGPVQMSVHSVSHDGQIQFASQSSFAGFSNGGYGSVQDGVFHSGMSNMYGKFDIASAQVLGTASSGIPNRDEDFGQVLGNLVFVGDDHGVGSALIPHQAQPDSRGPDVTWVHPADGAGGVALTSRVGVSLSDTADLDSVSTATFSLRPQGGAPLAGKFSAQMGLVNFAPDQPLTPNTLYEVEVNGVEDLAGNQGAAFHSTFATGSTAGTVGFLSFDVATAARVHVLFDARATALPAWLSTWVHEPGTVTTSAGGYTIHWRDVPAGPVVLGGNGDPPVAGAASNYLVVVSSPVTNITAASTRPYASGSLAVGAPLYIDRAYTYTGFPAGWTGRPYILTANDDKFATSAALGPSCATLSLTPQVARRSVSLAAGPVSGQPPFSYSWRFGDGSPPTPPAATPSTTHAYGAAGRYPVVLTVANAFGSTSCAGVQVVHRAPTALPPTRSSPIAHGGATVFAVNPDNDTVTAIDEATLQVRWEMPAGDHPRTLAVAPSGELWVVSQDDAMINVLRPSDGSRAGSIALPRASQPYGIAFRPDGMAAYVSLQAPGGLLELDPSGGVVLRQLALTGPARGLAVTADSSRVLVTRFLSEHLQLTGERRVERASAAALPAGNVWEVDSGAFAVVHKHRLSFDRGPDKENAGRGVPNYLSSLAISPDGRRALVPSNKDNVSRGLFFGDRPLTFESRTRTIVSQLDLVRGGEVFDARIDLNDRDMAQAAVFTPLGDLFLVASQGVNVIDVFEFDTGRQIATLGAGRSPQGMVFNPAGTRLYVQNFMSRSVTVYDTTSLVAGGNGAQRLADIDKVTQEALTPQQLLGKRIFYNAADRRMNLDGYTSCASCHLDGGHDGQVWDFTQSGEGLRNTIPLLGRAGTGHGNVHWTANFDEIQDFENDMRAGFGGAGFLTDAQFAATGNPLGPPKAGLSADLDALASYVASLNTFPASPYRDPGGSMTAAAQLGAVVFQAKGCPTCHVPPDYTDRQRHDVGTVRRSSGLGIGQPLPGVGFETPTLRAVWSSPPYLHNGRAPDLRAVLRDRGHVGVLTETEKDRLVVFLREIE